MKRAFISLSSLLVLLSYAPVAGSDEGWVDVQVSLLSAPAGVSQEPLEEAATVLARFAANAQLKYNQVPPVTTTKTANGYVLDFTPPGSSAKLYVTSNDLMRGRWNPLPRR